MFAHRGGLYVGTGREEGEGCQGGAGGILRLRRNEETGQGIRNWDRTIYLLGVGKARAFEKGLRRIGGVGLLWAFAEFGEWWLSEIAPYAKEEKIPELNSQKRRT